MDGLHQDADGVVHCAWQPDNPAVRAYHDNEYGRPSADETRIFEKFCLEILASGLNFGNLLRRRELVREAFDGFALDRVAEYGVLDLARLMRADGVVHNERKLRACLHNARLARALRARPGGLPGLLWAHEPGPEERPDRMTLDWMRANPTNASAARLARRLKAEGWHWVGPVVCYGVFQGLGLVNDHLEGCPLRPACSAARADFVPPA
ncbi:DNA-3-methyladenine glycosylase I [Jannaschia seohaensis]|uniref:DNA-3-methyladenine glycosylase I n=1 Tax=Jannaschia seohaensis TaxID=475081 RepID=A0A2Y9ARA9_9RHOB|nr:DNA-3-methyladenine glycosylase I [Jannaschia seohaensis]PWJ18091.1 DNA-3-methyladenine glycosylase I [Jannaschia seohaensis]SSA46616.1 DNA-3-methyladenine glycosylase I [Jannaschia seohaensis]